MAGITKCNCRYVWEKLKQFFKRCPNPFASSTCDSFVLKLHYIGSFLIMIVGYFVIYDSREYGYPITCTSKFNLESQVRLDQLNLCLMHPYIEEEDKTRRYLLFYRWMAGVLLFLSFFYIIPKIISRRLNLPQVKHLLEDLDAKTRDYDQRSGGHLVENTTRYFLFNMNTHNALYWRFLVVHVVGLLVNVLVMLILHGILQGRFMEYGLKAFPYTKDAQNSTDYMSKTFPSFVKCEINEGHEINGRRTERFGCHLLLMDLYEKVFLVLWFWMVGLALVTASSILCLAAFWPPLRTFLLRPAKPAIAEDDVKDILVLVLRKCKIGDVFLLYLIKRRMNHAQFLELLKALSAPDFLKQTSEDSPPPA